MVVVVGELVQNYPWAFVTVAQFYLLVQSLAPCSLAPNQWTELYRYRNGMYVGTKQFTWYKALKRFLLELNV